MLWSWSRLKNLFALLVNSNLRLVGETAVGKVIDDETDARFNQCLKSFAAVYFTSNKSNLTREIAFPAV